MEIDFESLGIKTPTILLPSKKVDMARWAVVACDQYTSEPEYWKEVEALVGSAPSTLRLIFPEVYLKDEEGSSARIENIHRAMKKYAEDGTLVSHGACFVLVDRQTCNTSSRKGLVVALDLEKYDYSKGSQSLIRATEGTIVERLPPRIKIRKNACLETSHIMVLIDDPEKTVIEPLFDEKVPKEKIYDFELMQGGGHIRGYKINHPDALASVAGGLRKLADATAFRKKYGVENKGVLLFAMGDGNHSLATAKAIWEDIKSNASDKDAVMKHPARYALVELVNIYDEGLKFEPIHRVVFNVNADELLKKFTRFLKEHQATLECKNCESTANLRPLLAREEGVHKILMISPNGVRALSISNPWLTLEVATLQAFLDRFLDENPGATLDYVHGDDVVRTLASRPDTVGFLLPPMPKKDLFTTVIREGALPRKTFSMGDASEKRFYLECRKIAKGTNLGEG